MAWGGAKDDYLKELWKQGLSATICAERINARFGTKFSRSAICGKVDRMGLPERSGENNKAHARRRLRRRAAKGNAKKKQPFALFKTFGFVDKNAPTKRFANDDYVPKPEEPAPEGQRKTVETLEESSCRWPIGDPVKPEFHFCGADRVEGLPYCSKHCAVAYVTPTLKKRELEREGVRETEDA